MFNRGIFAALAVSAAMMAPASAIEVSHRQSAIEVEAPAPVRRNRGYSELGGASGRRFRSRWKAQRRRVRTNRIHVSRAVRRRHRRAARGK